MATIDRFRLYQSALYSPRYLAVCSPDPINTFLLMINVRLIDICSNALVKKKHGLASISSSNAIDLQCDRQSRRLKAYFAVALIIEWE